MPFEPGKSGNPGGRPKTKLFADALRVQVSRPIGKTFTKPTKGRVIDEIAYYLVHDARTAKGSVRTQAAKEIRDTLDGKPAQALEHSGMIATTHEEYLKQLNGMNDTDREEDTDETKE